MNAPTTTQLGESPYWDRQSACLYWTDIKAKRIYRYDPLLQRHDVCEAPKMAAFVVRGRNGELIGGLEDGLYKMNFESGMFEPLALINEPDMRLNDGKCDPLGNIWFGTMPLDEGTDDAIGKLYCYADKITEKESGLGIPNGKVWSPDGRYFYHAETQVKTIWRYKLDAGEIRQREAFIKMDHSPDGMCHDSAGNLYIALYGNGRVDIYSPQGQKQSSIEVPVKEVTSCAFGGTNLGTLYITTAHDGLFEVQRHF